MHIVGRHQDQSTLNLARIELPHNFANRNWSLIFISVVSTFENDCRTPPIADYSNWNARDPPGVVIRRVRDHDKADLLAAFVQIDCQEGGASFRHRCRGGTRFLEWTGGVGNNFRQPPAPSPSQPKGSGGHGRWTQPQRRAPCC